MKTDKSAVAALAAARLSAVLLCAVPVLFSCRTLPPALPREAPPLPTFIMGSAAMDEDRLASFLTGENPLADRAKASRMAHLYIVEGRAEGVNPDVAFSQMCLETGFLSFRGLVTEDMNNFCGLGSIGPGQSGNRFPDEETGVRAHIQHLKGYASSEPLSLALVDPRYKYIQPKGKSPLIAGLAGTWASDPEYGRKLEGLLARLYAR